ncbi:MAG: hypothetical protein ACRCUJ_11795, partial [Phocaeicola sp.]
MIKYAVLSLALLSAGCAVPVSERTNDNLCMALGYAESSKDYGDYIPIYNELKTRSIDNDSCNLWYLKGIQDHEEWKYHKEHLRKTIKAATKSYSDQCFKSG